jgi:hypothetical protein
MNYLFILDLFNNACKLLHYIAPNDSIIGE